MFEDIGIAVGSVEGTEHKRIGKNNQDAFFLKKYQQFIIGLVFDGCGSGKHSEVGAKIASRIVPEIIIKWIDIVNSVDIYEVLLHLKWDIILNFRLLAEGMCSGENYPNHDENELKKILNDYFLFTINGVLIDRGGVWAFNVGDGIRYIDGEVQDLDELTGYPTYINYTIIDKEQAKWNTDFKIKKYGLEVLDSGIIIGSDGVKDIIKKADELVLGSEEKVGGLEQFLENRMYKNPDNINRRFNILNKYHTWADWNERRIYSSLGLLPDDTTIISIKRGVGKNENNRQSKC